MNKHIVREELSLPEYTIANILHTGNWMNEKFSSHLKQFAISIQQFQVLRSLKELKGASADLQTIKTYMVSKNSNTTRLVEKLRLKGLITRTQDIQNRRKVDIRITDEGLTLLKKIESIHTDFKNSIVSNLNTQEIITLNQLFVKIRNN